MVKIIIAGGRDLIIEREHIDYIDKKLESLMLYLDEIEFVTGCAKGADQIPFFYKNLGYKIKEFPANWKKYGKVAGYIRNKQMAEYSDLLIAFWDGKSRGTKNMIDLAIKYNLKYIIKEY